MSPDSIVPGATNPQAFNRYAYVLGNPLKYIDPSGHMQVNDGESLKGSNCHGQFAKYCTNGKPKSREELAKERKVKNRDILEKNKDEDVTTLPIPTITQPSSKPNPVNVNQFVRGAGLFVVGVALALVGGIILGAAIAEVVGGIATGPLEGLVVLHALAVGAEGAFFAGLGIAAIVDGYKTMKEARTP